MPKSQIDLREFEELDDENEEKRSKLSQKHRARKLKGKGRDIKPSPNVKVLPINPKVKPL